MEKQWSYVPGDINNLTSTDLRAEALEALAKGMPIEMGIITLYDEQGYQLTGETPDYLYLPSEGRLGIAWGADATWADVDDLESGINMWVNHNEDWELAN